MPEIIQCECGARVRLPDGRSHRVVRCPKCRTGLALSTNATVLQPRTLAPAESGAICPICQTEIGRADLIVACPKCDQVHHHECWAEVGGCGTYGCAEASAPDKSQATTSTPLTAWGDTKPCPACGETIKAIALKCRYCKTTFDTVDPMTVTDLKRQSRREEKLTTVQKNVIALFVVSILGCLAPLMVIIAPLVVVPKRDLLRKSGPIYLLMGYASIALSVLYSILMFALGVLDNG